MSINVGQVSHHLSDGSRFYAYSGVVQGDVSVPATITLISIPNTGLKDSFIEIQPFFGSVISSAGGAGLGLSIQIDDIEIMELSYEQGDFGKFDHDVTPKLFVPRGSKLEVISNNTSANNTQTRGCTLLGWCL